MVLGRGAEKLSIIDSSATAKDVNLANHTPETGLAMAKQSREKENSIDDIEEEPRPDYANAMLAGGIGGLCADMVMHSLDTVKTRQQGDPYRPPKYHTLGNTYWTIFRQEGIARGLYGGVIPAAIGSFGGTSIFFGAYEWSKRLMIDNGMAPPLAYLSAGIVADLVISPLYVPTEVLKTRLQLQGRYNNPHFKSGFNYRSTWNATKTIVRKEGLAALFFGYRATLYRDVPFSAFQFAIYEEARKFAKRCVGSQDIGLPLEILTAASAGGLAGTITTPLDVVKTRIQTQVHPSALATLMQRQPSGLQHGLSSHRVGGKSSTAASTTTHLQNRAISTSPSTTILKPDMTTLATSSISKGLAMIYKAEGVGGIFRGVGPRAVWTSVQSGTMLVLYQELLRYLESRNAEEEYD